jgi:hypothetical protein
MHIDIGVNPVHATAIAVKKKGVSNQPADEKNSSSTIRSIAFMRYHEMNCTFYSEMQWQQYIFHVNSLSTSEQINNRRI